MPSTFADGLFWVSVACCVVAQLLIIRSIRGREHAPEPTAAAPRSGRVSEVVWAVLPAIALFALLFHTWRTMQAR